MTYNETNLYNFEVYLKEPITHEEGWEIADINVYALSVTEARAKLKNVPDFDVVILFNCELERKYWDDEDVAAYAHGDYYRFTKIGGETVLPAHYLLD